MIVSLDVFCVYVVLGVVAFQDRARALFTTSCNFLNNLRKI
jgi:hypothetical protein